MALIPGLFPLQGVWRVLMLWGGGTRLSVGYRPLLVTLREYFTTRIATHAIKKSNALPLMLPFRTLAL